MRLGSTPVEPKITTGSHVRIAESEPKMREKKHASRSDRDPPVEQCCKETSTERHRRLKCRVNALRAMQNARKAKRVSTSDEEFLKEVEDSLGCKLEDVDLNDVRWEPTNESIEGKPVTREDIKRPKREFDSIRRRPNKMKISHTWRMRLYAAGATVLVALAAFLAYRDHRSSKEPAPEKE